MESKERDGTGRGGKQGNYTMPNSGRYGSLGDMGYETEGRKYLAVEKRYVQLGT